MKLARHPFRATSLLVISVVALTGGCANPGPGAGDAAAAAHGFVAAVASGDGAAACALLAPDAAVALARDQGSSCAEAVVARDVASRVAPRPPMTDGEAKAFGREAQVHLDGDVLFLAMSKHGWVVNAAGCTPRPEQPYDCAIRGS